AALTAWWGPPAGRAGSRAGLGGMGDERCQLPAERGGMGGAQVDLVTGAADGESHCLIGRASVKIVFECDGCLLCHPRLPGCGQLMCTVQDQLPWRAAATPLVARPSHGCTRPAAARVISACREFAGDPIMAVMLTRRSFLAVVGGSTA